MTKKEAVKEYTKGFTNSVFAEQDFIAGWEACEKASVPISVIEERIKELEAEEKSSGYIPTKLMLREVIKELKRLNPNKTNYSNFTRIDLENQNKNKI